MLDPDTAPLNELNRELTRLQRQCRVTSHEVGERDVRPDDIDDATWPGGSQRTRRLATPIRARPRRPRPPARSSRSSCADPPPQAVALAAKGTQATLCPVLQRGHFGAMPHVDIPARSGTLRDAGARPYPSSFGADTLDDFVGGSARGSASTPPGTHGTWGSTTGRRTAIIGGTIRHSRPLRTERSPTRPLVTAIRWDALGRRSRCDAHLTALVKWRGRSAGGSRTSCRPPTGRLRSPRL